MGVELSQAREWVGEAGEVAVSLELPEVVLVRVAVGEVRRVEGGLGLLVGMLGGVVVCVQLAGPLGRPPVECRDDGRVVVDAGGECGERVGSVGSAGR